jgi:outer membrane receptor for ferric coprogen and ferric-rhodotorulic acid
MSINFIRREPHSLSANHLRAIVGDCDLFKTEAAVDGPLSKRFRARVAY